MVQQRTLLYLAREYPLPLNSAARLRTFNWLLHLSKRFQVTLVAPARGNLTDMERQALEGRCHRVIVARRQSTSVGRLPQRLWRGLTHLFTGIPAEAHALIAGDVAQQVRHLMRAQRFDVAFAERWTQVNLATSAAPFSMLDAGELQTPRQAIESQYSNNPLRRMLRALWFSMQTEAEATALSRFHLILLNRVPARDELLRVIGTVNSTLVLPEGLNTEHFSPPESNEFNPRRIVFYSSLRSFNQQDALHHLRVNLLPRVQRRFGNVGLTVISQSCPAPLREQLQADPDVVYYDMSDDPRPRLQGAAVAVLPLRLGRGSRSRLIQLLAMGVPTVATPLATAGLEVASGDGLLIAKEDGDFADAICQILEDGSLRRDLAARGRALAEARLSLHATYGHLTDVLSEASLDLHGTQG
jgi:glycosyltransferase involved in cell wall biosynthesis